MKKLVVITGAGSGIGRATAKRLSAEGHPLLLLDINLAAIENLKLPNTICKNVDVAKVDEFKQAIKEAEKIYGKVDCLVNNAGIMLLGQAQSQDPKEWEKMININVMGVLNGIHSVLHDMIRRNEGTIVNMSSIAGKKTFPNHAAYCGTKFAVHAITENIREEVSSSNIRMITIAPGVVETPLLSHTTSNDIIDSYESWKEQIGGGLQPENVANAIYFAYSQPQNICIREIVIATTGQDS